LIPTAARSLGSLRVDILLNGRWRLRFYEWIVERHNLNYISQLLCDLQWSQRNSTFKGYRTGNQQLINELTSRNTERILQRQQLHPSSPLSHIQVQLCQKPNKGVLIKITSFILTPRDVGTANLQKYRGRGTPDAECAACWDSGNSLLTLFDWVPQVNSL